MFAFDFQQIAILLVILVLIFGRRLLSRLNGGEEPPFADLRRDMPVFSAETTRGKEAEFIRDRLPKRFPYAVLLIAVLVVAGTIWWLSR